MVGIVEPVGKEVESKDPFKDLITNHKATLRSIALTVDLIKPDLVSHGSRYVTV